MNKITILTISAVFVASILTITAFEAEAIPDKVVGRKMNMFLKPK